MPPGGIFKGVPAGAVLTPALLGGEVGVGSELLLVGLPPDDDEETFGCTTGIQGPDLDPGL
jgi:hypothetical protein